MAKKTTRSTTSQAEDKSSSGKAASGKKTRSRGKQADDGGTGTASTKSSAGQTAAATGKSKAGRSPVKSKTATRAEDAPDSSAGSTAGDHKTEGAAAEAAAESKSPSGASGKSKSSRSSAAGRSSAKAANGKAGKAKAPETAEPTNGDPPRKRTLQVVAKTSAIRPRQITDATGQPPTVYLGSKDNGSDAASREPLTEDDLRRVKSGLTKRDLERYRKILLERAAEIKGDVEALRQDARNEAGKDISYDHMADAGSDTFEQDLNLGLVESEQRNLTKIYDALSRMDKGYYGVCIESGKPIGKPRLDIKPWAKYCIEVAREKDPKLL